MVQEVGIGAASRRGVFVLQRRQAGDFRQTKHARPLLRNYLPRLRKIQVALFSFLGLNQRRLVDQAAEDLVLETSNDDQGTEYLRRLLHFGVVHFELAGNNTVRCRPRDLH